MQPDVALEEIFKELHPFSELLKCKYEYARLYVRHIFKLIKSMSRANWSFID